MRPDEKGKAGHLIGGIIFLMVAGGSIWGVFQSDPTSQTLNKQEATPTVKNTPQQKSLAVADIRQEQQKAKQIEPVRGSNPVGNPGKDNRPEYPQGTIFKYTDANGLVTMVDDLAKVPERSRKKMTVAKGGTEQQRTPIDVVNNQVYVPVSLTYQGSTVTARLLLDTGATGITISPALAKRLGAQPTSRGTSTLADGRQVQTLHFTCDTVSVGSKIKSPERVNIIPRQGTEETGLLGMSFLAEFPHTIDLKAKVIKWL